MINLENLKILRDYVEENKRLLNCEMFYYQKTNCSAVGIKDAFNKIDPCLTSCCFLGCAPLAGLDIEDFDEDWSHYSARVFSVAEGDEAWRFLFSPHWVDSFDECIARADKVLAGFDPENDPWDINDRYSSDLEVAV